MKKQDLKSKIISKVERDLADIETALHENLNPYYDLVSDIAGHLLFSGGKRLRPLLMILSSRICDYKNGSEIKFSTIFEYIHTATLLHDDVIDQAKMRRGKNTAHIIWDPSQVVLTGDFLLARAMALVSETKLFEVVETITNIIEDMTQGEIVQLNKKGKINLTEHEYMEIIRRKTGVLIQGACKTGAIIAKASKEKIKALSDYGYYIGMAFQMADDLLDYTSDTKTMGKNTGIDIKEGKLTLPLIVTLKKACKDDKEWLCKIIKNQNFKNKDFKDIVAMLHKYKGIEYTRIKALEYVEKAKKTLKIFKLCKSKEIMNMIADYSILRKV
ncbi:MAG: polyprenyl synthetase [Desulfobacteraceae bacterium 4572_130]|nr:MAG: polyprenyl synthetase [Desulfobacteraceae bacterium 4572_130]